ncbi:AdoMet-homocysteine methyltransferase [Rhinocladiella similis]
MAKELLDKRILVLDGGLGTTLEDEHGVKFSSKTPLWSSHLLVENTSTLKKVQHDFANAGADVILTATYQSSFDGFTSTKIPNKGRIGLEEAKRYMLSAVDLAREAFHGRPGLVALSLGAYGATMIPSTEYSGAYGSMTEKDLFDFHMNRILTFKESQKWEEIDLVAFETLPRIDEVRAVSKVMQRLTDKPYWISCVFPNDDQKLPDGTNIDELIRTLFSKGARPPWAIGFNCTKIHKVAGVISAFENTSRQLSIGLPRLVVYPDGAGNQVYDTKLQQWVGDNSDQKPWEVQVADIIQEVAQRGSWKGFVLGGCCKTTPYHIQKLRTRLDALK